MYLHICIYMYVCVCSEFVYVCLCMCMCLCMYMCDQSIRSYPATIQGTENKGLIRKI